MGEGFWGRLLDCFQCLSLWIAAPIAFYLGEGVWERLLLWPAISGGAILLQRATNREQVVPAPYFEEEGVDDAVLRRPEEAPLSADFEG